MKLWIDDVRKAPDDSWISVKTYKGAIGQIYAHMDNLKVVSFDHDLADYTGTFGREMTGYDILMYIVENRVLDENFMKQCKFVVHSANPVAQDKMNGVIERYLT